MISISSGIYNHYFEAVDYLLQDQYIAKIITLVYITNKSNNSIDYNSMIDNTEEVTETISVRLYHSPRDWLKSGTIQFVDGRVQILGFMADAEKLMKSTEIRFGGRTYKLTSSPLPHGFGSRYFIAFLDVI